MAHRVKFTVITDNTKTVCDCIREKVTLGHAQLLYIDDKEDYKTIVKLVDIIKKKRGELK